jgi:hypothetical protein
VNSNGGFARVQYCLTADRLKIRIREKRSKLLIVSEASSFKDHSMGLSMCICELWCYRCGSGLYVLLLLWP